MYHIIKKEIKSIKNITYFKTTFLIITVNVIKIIIEVASRSKDKNHTEASWQGRMSREESRQGGLPGGEGTCQVYFKRLEGN